MARRLGAYESNEPAQIAIPLLLVHAARAIEQLLHAARRLVGPPCIGSAELVVLVADLLAARWPVRDDHGLEAAGHGTLQELDASDEPLVQAFMRSQGGG